MNSRLFQMDHSKNQGENRLRKIRNKQKILTRVANSDKDRQKWPELQKRLFQGQNGLAESRV